MSTCQSCHERDAVVHLTQVVGEDVSTMHLCSKCAAERGIETEAAVAHTQLGAFLAAMGSGGPGMAAAAATGEMCPQCGATLEHFRASGRLGCSGCWVTFERPLRDLVRRAHGATKHTGERYEEVDTVVLSAIEQRERDQMELEEQLRLAVASEHFERAAELRDQLRVSRSA